MLKSSLQVILFCLPYSGANAFAYRNLPDYLEDFIRFAPVELPGHGTRVREPLISSVDELVADVFINIKEDLKQPYAIFGHSLGTYIGFSLTRHIINKGLPAPVHLFFSGNDGPSVSPKRRDRHLLPKAGFLKELERYGGCAPEILQNQEVVDFFEPILRADFKVVETFYYTKEEPFNVPLTVMIGKEDTTSFDGAQKWQMETTKTISIKEFPGGHFFIFDHLPEIGEIISEALRKTG